jgi:hypothetical protein
MTTATQPLVGNALLAHIERFPDASKTELCLTAGYVNSQGKPAYVAFYTELLNAQPIVTDHNKDAADDAEYDELPEDKQALYDEVHERFGEKWNHEEIMEFVLELVDIGIENVSQLEDAYVYTHDEWVSTAERDFAEWFVCTFMDEPPSDIIAAAVDWQAVWDHNLRYEFNTIEFDGTAFFFFNR